MNQIKIIFLFLLFFSFTIVNAQNHKIDSLEQLVAKHARIDKAKVDMINELAYEVTYDNSEKARSYANQALQMATDLDYQKGKAAGLWIVGLTIQKKDKKQALNYYEQALEIAERIDDKAGICNYLISIGSASKLLGDGVKGEECQNRALSIAEKLGDERLQIKSLLNLSLYKTDKGDYAEAIRLAQKTIRIANKIGDKRLLENGYTHLGFIYYRQGDECRSLEYNLLALKMAEQLNTTSAIFSKLVIIGGIQSTQKMYDEALGTLQRASQIARSMNDSLKIATCLANIGYIYMSQSKPEGFGYYQQALQVIGNKDLRMRQSVLMNIGGCYVEQEQFDLAEKSLDESFVLAQKLKLERSYCEIWKMKSDLYLARKQYSQAIAYAEKVINLASKINYLELQKDGYSLLSKLDAIVGDYKGAYQSHLQYKLLNDSIFNDKKTRELALLESSYKFEKEKQTYEMENKNHLLEIKNQQHIILFLIIATLLILILLFILYWSNKLKKRVLKLEIEKVNQELEYSQKEMTSATLKLVQTSECDAYCVKLLENIKKNTTEEVGEDVNSLLNYYKSKSIYSNWEEFETLFIKVNGKFYDTLNQQFPTLTPNERKLCVFLKLNMSSKDIAQITFQSEEALKKARLRLRKKLNLDRDINLSSFIQSL